MTERRAQTSTVPDAAVSLDGITKTFPGVRALDGVSIDFRPGEVHSIVGENGAGKSTLVKILTGVQRQDEGTLRIGGHTVNLHTPRQARRHGVSFVPQEVDGVPNFSVGRSVLLGRESYLSGRTALSEAERKTVLGALATMGLADVDIDAPLTALSTAQKRLCQIAGTLVAPGALIILDEPTAVLSDADAGVLLDRIEALRDEGRSIVYISHRLGEVLRLSDRISVLRDGQLVGTYARGEVDRNDLVTLMARVQGERQSGKATVADAVAPESVARQAGEAGLLVNHLYLGGILADVSFEAVAGQVVGIAGIQGSGHCDLLDALSGSRDIDGGTVTVEGRSIRPGDVRAALRAGIRLVPEDRRGRGIIGQRSLRENLSVAFGSEAQRTYFRRYGDERRTATEAVESLGIVPGDTERAVQHLSGGNQQKVLIARALGSRPKVLLLAEPTQGIDVRAKAEILRLVVAAARERNLAVVLASSEFEELLDYTDVLYVMRKGSIVKKLDTARTDYREVLELAVP